jgi:hypothetical protein
MKRQGIKKEGWLTVSDGNRKVWKRRFFRLDERKKALQYFEYGNGSKMVLRGEISLHNTVFAVNADTDTATEPTRKNTKPGHSLPQICLRSPRRVTCLSTKRAEDILEWSAALEEIQIPREDAGKNDLEDLLLESLQRTFRSPEAQKAKKSRVPRQQSPQSRAGGGGGSSGNAKVASPPIYSAADMRPFVFDKASDLLDKTPAETVKRKVALNKVQIL